MQASSYSYPPCWKKRCFWVESGTHGWGWGRDALGKGRGGGGWVGVGLISVGLGMVGWRVGWLVGCHGCCVVGLVSRAAVVEVGSRCHRLRFWGLVWRGLVAPVLGVEGLVLVFVLGSPTGAPHLVTHIVVRSHVELVDRAAGLRHLRGGPVEQRSGRKRRVLFTTYLCQ